MTWLSFHAVPSVGKITYDKSSQAILFHLTGVGSSVLNPIALRLKNEGAMVNEFTILAQLRQAVDEAFEDMLEMVGAE